MIFFTFIISFASSIDPPTHEFHLKCNDYGSKYYRIPAIVTAKDGSLITSTDKRWYHAGDLPQAMDVVIRRSTDHGKTWSEPLTIAGLGTEYGYGDSSLAVDPKTGAVLCIYNGGPGIHDSTPEVPTRQYYSISHDNGITWSDPIEFTDYIYGINCTDPERRTWLFTFLTAGRALATRDGRIMVVGVIHPPNKGYHNYIVYTDDLGKTWHVGKKPACENGDESKVTELVNGSILMSIRNGSGHRYFAISNDKGDTWLPWVHRYDMVDPYCNGEILRYTSTLDGFEKNRLIHTNLYSIYELGRKNLTIKVSYDEGETWPYSKVLYEDKAAYSTATIDTDGTIVIYWEKEDEPVGLVITRMSIDYLTDGADTYKPPTKKVDVE